MPSRLCAAVLLAALLGPPASAKDDPAALAAAARQVLKTHCYRCHAGDGSSSGYPFDVTKHDSLTKKIDADEPQVVANSLDKSPLWDAIRKPSPEKSARMPQKESSERNMFGDTEREVIKKWIVAGAPPFPEATARPFRTLRAELTAVRDHLNAADRTTRPHLRYFTLANQHNDPRVTDEDMRYLRAALSKVLNSLSWKAKVVVPEAVDKSETLYAFDLRAVDWDTHDQWKKLVDAYPYGLKYGSHPDDSLRDLDRDITRECGQRMPVLRADWFVSTASRPPCTTTCSCCRRTRRSWRRSWGWTSRRTSRPTS